VTAYSWLGVSTAKTWERKEVKVCMALTAAAPFPEFKIMAVSEELGDRVCTTERLPLWRLYCSSLSTMGIGTEKTVAN